MGTENREFSWTIDASLIRVCELSVEMEMIVKSVTKSQDHTTYVHDRDEPDMFVRSIVSPVFNVTRIFEPAPSG